MLAPLKVQQIMLDQLKIEQIMLVLLKVGYIALAFVEFHFPISTAQLKAEAVMMRTERLTRTE